MDIILRDLERSIPIILPLTYGVAIAVVLMLIYRMLGSWRTLRGLALPYAVGALALGVGVAVATASHRLGTSINPTLRSALLAILSCCWGFVGLGLAEDLVIERWILRQGVNVPRLARDIGRALAFIVVVLLTVRFILGVELSSIVISSTVLSAVIGLALQDLLKNVIAGIALQMERPFDVGHWVQINNQIGRVVEMSWRATRVITVDGNYIIYPNSNLAQFELTNFTLGSPLQAMHVQVGIGYSHPPNLVKRVLTEAALAAEGVVPEPRPSIKVIQYGDYAVTYDVKFWIADYDRYTEKRDSVMTNIWYSLHRAGVRLPLPIRNVYMHQVDPLTEAQQRHAQIEALVADLRRVDLFEVLSDTELYRLAEHVGVRLYAAGEALVRQGDPGDTFFIIRSGRVRIDVCAGENGSTVTVNRLGRGEFFGELALLTGAPRGATVIAEEDTETLVVAQADIALLLQANPSLPERLGEVLARRLEMNRAALAVRRDEEMPSEAISRPTLVHRIRHLFGLDGR